MRVRFNLAEQKRVREDTAALPNEVDFINLSYLLYQPPETSGRWMQEIIRSKEEAAIIGDANIGLRVDATTYQEVIFAEQAPMANALVITAPSGTSDDAIVEFYNRRFTRFLIDIYGIEFVDRIIRLWGASKYPVTLMQMSDFDTPFVITMDPPSFTDEASLKAYAIDHTADAYEFIFKILDGKVTSDELREQYGDESDVYKYWERDQRTLDLKLTVPPRRVVMNDNQEEPVRSTGADIGFYPNHVAGDHRQDRIFLEAYWRELIKILSKREKPTS